MALPSRDKFGRWAVFSPLNASQLRLDEKSGSPGWSFQNGDASFKLLRDALSEREAAAAYPATFEARKASDGSLNFETPSRKALLDVAKEHVSRMLGPAQQFATEPVPAPASARNDSWAKWAFQSQDLNRPSAFEWARWEGPKLRSGPFAKAFKRLVSQSGLSPMGWEAVSSVASGAIHPAWIQAARGLGQGARDERSEILRLIRQAFDQALSSDLPPEGEGIACLLLASFGPAVDPDMAARAESLYQMWWGAGAEVFQKERGWKNLDFLRKVSTWDLFAQELKDAPRSWAQPVSPDALGLELALRREDFALESRAAVEAQTKLALCGSDLATQALLEAAATESHWLRLADLPEAANGLLGAESSRLGAAHGVALSLEEAKGSASASRAFDGTLSLMSAMNSSRSGNSIDQERKKLNRLLAHVGFDAQARAHFEASPWSAEFSKCVQAAVEAGQGDERAPWSGQTCAAMLCGFVAVSKKTPAPLRAPLSSEQIAQLSHEIRRFGGPVVKFPFEGVNVSIKWKEGHGMPKAEPGAVLDFFIEHAGEVSRQAERLGLDFLSRVLNEPALPRIEQSALAVERSHYLAPLSSVAGQPLPLRWDGAKQWDQWCLEAVAAKEKKLDELESKLERQEQALEKQQPWRETRQDRSSTASSPFGASFRDDQRGYHPHRPSHPFDLHMEGFLGAMRESGNPALREHMLEMRQEHMLEMRQERLRWHGVGGDQERLDAEVVLLVSEEGFAGQMALLAMTQKREPELREGANARSRANAWLGEGKALAKEWMGLTEGAWRGAKQSPLAGSCVLSECFFAGSEASLGYFFEGQDVTSDSALRAKRLGQFLNVASASGLSMEAAALAGRAGRTSFAAGEMDLEQVAWARLSESCEHGVGAEAILRGVEREMRAAQALRPRWIAAVIERAGQLMSKAPAEDFEASLPNALLLGKGHQRSGLCKGEADVAGALSQELHDMGDWAKDWAGRFYAQLPTKLTWKTLSEGSALWHEEALKRKDPESSWDAIGLEWKGSGALEGLEAHELCSSSLLASEGSAMRHCVGTYGANCRDGHSRIVSIKDGGRRVSTLQLSTSSALASRGGSLPVAAHDWVVSQHRAACNAEPSERAKQAGAQILLAARQASLLAVEKLKAERAHESALDSRQDVRKAQADLEAWSAHAVPVASALADKLKARAKQWEAEAVAGSHLAKKMRD
jgi:hypothetical protein